MSPSTAARVLPKRTKPRSSSFTVSISDTIVPKSDTGAELREQTHYRRRLWRRLMGILLPIVRGGSVTGAAPGAAPESDAVEALAVLVVP
jgi:hypothetical protein